jgi:hypothetical protein
MAESECGSARRSRGTGVARAIGFKEEELNREGTRRTEGNGDGARGAGSF